MLQSGLVSSGQISIYSEAGLSYTSLCLQYFCCKLNKNASTIQINTTISCQGYKNNCLG